MKKLMLTIFVLLFSLPVFSNECLEYYIESWHEEVGSPISQPMLDEWEQFCLEDPKYGGDYRFELKIESGTYSNLPYTFATILSMGDPVYVTDIIINRGRCNLNSQVKQRISNSLHFDYADTIRIPVTNCGRIMELVLITNVGNYEWDLR